ncbi:CoA transferase [Sphingobium sp. JS3065]|uniref:CaiB/BaiF CoA transferase family protein n=1 Tax=Sphingobium sp. JS3065 TaxID=2970925 RepID=UPI002264445B|nr:CoA transferase [Sphingobium sp. JS3065]UZW53822.1 CoA transferase [Sphingobium sp. JS3065]
MGEPRSGGALSDLKIVDLTQMLAGPFATMMLADHGAEVIKIESIEGELARHAQPCRPEDIEHVFPGYFVSVNRNKRSVALNLKSDASCEIVRKLAANADVVVENFRSGVMDRLGLSFDVLREDNPKLVYASIRGFGDTVGGSSPLQDWPAFDVVAQAMGGMMGITGPEENMPTKVGPGVGDTIPAMHCAFGILAAVHHARKTGRGQYVDISMLDSVLAVCERIIHQYSIQGYVAGPEGNHHPVGTPFGLFPASDGWIAIGAHKDDFWRRLCKALDVPELADREGFVTTAQRAVNKKAVQDAISEVTKKYSKAELTKRLGAIVPYGPVLNSAEIMEHPHFRARNMIVPIDYPGIDKPIETVGVPVKLSETPGGIHRRAPRHGEHTAEVLRELGMDDGAIRDLAERGAIAMPPADWIQVAETKKASREALQKETAK